MNTCLNDEDTELCCHGIVLVDYIGNQDDGQGGRFGLYNLLDDLPEHPRGSTVTAKTIWAAGYGYVEHNVFQEGEI